MRTSAADTSDERSFARQPGEEPLPGYKLLHPLGLGGFGEVWKCEAPGGLQKAMKFVPASKDGQTHSFRQEFDAFQQIKATRHPFLLTLERVELVNGDLVMVMELADAQLQDRFAECIAEGHIGIPRHELLGYLVDAAEALDYIGNKFGLQHLDVKPANLFLVSGHVKVGDYGLVGGFQTQTKDLTRGLTPKYTAPEILKGQIDPRSDQYCLALVYAELLTGQFPYNARSAQQLMLQHVSSKPDLTALPFCDQPVVAKALSKIPGERYRSCVEFLHGLVTANFDPNRDRPQVFSTTPSPSGTITVGPNSSAVQTHPNGPLHAPPVQFPKSPSGTQPHPNARNPLSPAHTVPSLKNPLGPAMTIPAQVRTQSAPGLVTQRRPSPTVQQQPPAAPPRAPQISPHGGPSYQQRPPQQLIPPDPEEEVLDLISAAAPRANTWPFQLERMWPVMPVTWLRNESNQVFEPPNAIEFAHTLTRAARPDMAIPPSPGDPVKLKDGSWFCRFPVRQIAGVARVKLDVLLQEFYAGITQPDPSCFIIQKVAKEGFWDRWNGKAGGIEMVVQLPSTSSIGMVEVTARVFGDPPAEFLQKHEGTPVKMVDAAKRLLQNCEDRRKDCRVQVSFPVTLFPVHGDGTVLPPIMGQTMDVSYGGMCCQTTAPIDAAHVFVACDGVAATAGWAILMRLTRMNPSAVGQLIAGRFRTDL